MDAHAVEAVDHGMKALSCGYSTELVPIPGGCFRRDDVFGGAEVHADFLQTEILNNHTALVDRGRAGPTARLDSAGNQDQGDEETMMTPEEKKALEDAQAAAKAEKERADRLDAENAIFQKSLKDRQDAEAKGAKTALIARVQPIVKKDAAELEKLEAPAIMREALAALQPDVKTDGWSDAALEAALEVALRVDAKRPNSATRMAKIVSDVREDEREGARSDEEDENASANAYQKMRQDSMNHWRGQSKK